LKIALILVSIACLISLGFAVGAVLERDKMYSQFVDAHDDFMELQQQVDDNNKRFLSCGDAAVRLLNLWQMAGGEGRLVATLTKEAWDRKSDGHTLVELKIKGQWVLFDGLTGYRFMSHGKYLNLVEAIKAIQANDFKIVSWIDSLYTYEIPKTELRMDYKRVMQSPLIYTDYTWYTCDNQTASYAGGYIMISEDEWNKKFYEN
jgi:hypothetical protein